MMQDHRKTLIALIIGMLSAAARSDGRPTQTDIYPSTITPHPGLGRFRPPHDPDRPVMACYGGIGLRDLGNGHWTGYGITSKADIDRLIARCREYGISRIYASLLEQSPPSRYLRPPPAGAEDLIPYAIDRAHAAGILVYADIPTFAVGEWDRPFLDANRELLTHSESGAPDPHMFSPAWPKVRAYKRAILLEWLARYPVDGIQLDFIRWPYYGDDLLHGVCAHGYDDPLLRELRRRHGLADSFRPRPDDPRFLQIRREYISLFIRELRDTLESNGINLPVGVYNSNAYGRVPSMHDVCQDWLHWEQHRLVDEHHPMFLLDSITRLARAAKSLTDIKRPGSTVFGPIFLAEGFQPAEGFVPTADMCREAARRLIKLGCDGIWFCRAGEIEEFNLWPVVREISRYSLREVRAQSFDPLYENLVPNGDFESGLEGWQADPADAARVDDVGPASGGRCLRIDARPEYGVRIRLRTPPRFSTHPAYAVRSLGLAFYYQDAELRTDPPVRVVLRLMYTDGTMDEKPVAPASGAGQWKPTNTAFRVTRERAKLVRDAEIEIVVPAGTGHVRLDRIELIYDPLDNPLIAFSGPGTRQGHPKEVGGTGSSPR